MLLCSVYSQYTKDDNVACMYPNNNVNNMQFYAIYGEKKLYNRIYYVILTTQKTILSILINQAFNLYTKQIE